MIYIYIYIWVYVWVRICMYVCLGVCISTCMYVGCVYVYECMFMWVHELGCVLQRFGPVWWGPDPLQDSDLCPLWTQYTGDSKTNPWDDPEVSIGSCSKDQTVIRIQNHVISCECLLLYHFLIYRCQYYLYVTCNISCDRLIYFTSRITCIISCDISECSLWLYSAYQCHFMC